MNWTKGSRSPNGVIAWCLGEEPEFVITHSVEGYIFRFHMLKTNPKAIHSYWDIVSREEFVCEIWEYLSESEQETLITNGFNLIELVETHTYTDTESQ